jgi:hypothetical protein
MRHGFRARGAWSRKLAFAFWTLLVVAYAAMAGSVVIDALDEDYRDLSQVSATTVESPQDKRNLSAAQLAAVYRARSGAPFASLPPGSTLKVVWPDGSSEYVVIVDPASSTGVEPIPGSQIAADGGHPDAPVVQIVERARR